MRDIKTILNSIESRILVSNSIGLFMSGGFDSTVLAYTIFKILNDIQSTTRITIYTVPRFDDSVVHVERIVSWLKNIFPKQNYKNVICGNPNLHHSKQVLSGILEISLRNECDIIILGDTMNPENLPNGPERIIAKQKLYFQPFIHNDKRITLLIAQYHNILDTIAELSHTCTESTTLRCNKCWQCCERAWAFDDLKLKDTGTM